MEREEVKKVKEMSKSSMKNRKGYEKWKRLSDIILSALGLIVLSPLFLLLILWIKVDSRGPVFFKQKRVGIHKTYFDILKFRTMRTDTPKDMPTHMLTNPERGYEHHRAASCPLESGGSDRRARQIRGQ